MATQATSPEKFIYRTSPTASEQVDAGPGDAPGSLTVSWIPAEGPVSDYVIEYRPAGSSTWPAGGSTSTSRGARR